MDTIIGNYLQKLDQLCKSQIFSFGEITPSSLPSGAGVYRIFTDSAPDQTLYVGKSTDLSNRLYRNHLMGNSQSSAFRRKLIRERGFDETEAKDYLRSGCFLQTLLILNGRERSLFEHFAISVLQPKYND